jgi:hypothetical protein
MSALIQALIAIAMMIVVVPATASERVALVIGNSQYAWQSPLSNPLNDATTMAATLSNIGYDVTSLFDLDENGMEQALAEFAEQADTAEIALIFYSGHGMEIGGKNYLIPVDAKLHRERDAKFEAVDLESVRAATEGASKLKVVILDACRNNTFLPTTRSGGARGLSRIVAQAGEVIAYSTAPGSVAQDGVPGELSPYTRALSEKLQAEPELDVRFLFTSLGRLTEEYAGVAQRPYTEFASILPEGALPLGTATGKRDAGSEGAEAIVEAALAGRNRADLEAALNLAPQSPRRGEMEAALALHDRLDAAIAARDTPGLEAVYVGMAEDHPRRRELREALRATIIGEACGRLLSYAVSCPAEILRFSAGAEAVTPTAAPVTPAPVMPTPSAPPPDPFEDYLSDTSPESLTKANSIDIKWIQAAFQALGHYRGAIDGSYGSGTRRGVRTWRAAENLSGDEGDLSAKEIVMLIKQAAERDAQSAAYLGVMYGLGVGVDRDIEQSRELLQTASRDGFRDADQYLASISQTWKD